MHKTRFIRLSIILAFLFFSPSLAFGQVFEFQLKNKIQKGQGKPTLILKANEKVKNIRVKMQRSDGKNTTTKLGTMRSGQSKKVYFKQKFGLYTYNVTVTGQTKGGEKIKTTLETEVAWVEPIQLNIDKSKVNLPKGKLLLQTKTHLDKVDIEVFNKNGDRIHASVQDMKSMKGELLIHWPPTSGEVGAVKITAHDLASFWSAVILEPFFVDIPHQELVFETGKATWEKDETPKLEATLKQIRIAMKKHKRKGLSLQLYVAGYTDTVGSSASNMTLSRARAKSIAKWFRKNGLRISIYYQGFGESALAIQTADNVDELGNRRAVYILGNTRPPISKQLPRSNWGKL